MPVEGQKPGARAGAGGGGDRRAASSMLRRDIRKDSQRRNDRPGGQAVEAVGQVDRVNRSGDRQDAEQKPEPMRRRRSKTSRRGRARRAERGSSNRRSSAGTITATSAVARNFVRARSPRLRPRRIAEIVVERSDRPRRRRRESRAASAAGRGPPHSATRMTTMKTRPPIVGVPLLRWCVLGASSYACCRTSRRRST